MKFYISDTHFGHANAITFDKRPFTSVEEMNETLITNWNACVTDHDVVYFLGDFCYKCKDPTSIVQRLHGKKYWILGNHDSKVRKTLESYFEEVDNMMLIHDEYNGEKVRVHLCHYPLAEWNNYFNDAWHVHGHIHGSTHRAYSFLAREMRALNAGCMLNGYKPVMFAELVQNNMRFKKGIITDGI